MLFLSFRYYCQQRGLDKPEGLCLPGFFCNGSASRPDPPKNICPLGHYCVEGTYIPQPCPRGYFANRTGSQNLSDCTPCSPGKWCDPNAGAGVTEQVCSAGFICVLGLFSLFAYHLVSLNYVFY